MMMNKKKPFSLHLDVDSFMPATAEEKEVISRMRPSSTFFRDGVKRLLILFPIKNAPNPLPTSNTDDCIF